MTYWFGEFRISPRVTLFDFITEPQQASSGPGECASIAERRLRTERMSVFRKTFRVLPDRGSGAVALASGPDRFPPRSHPIRYRPPGRPRFGGTRLRVGGPPAMAAERH